ncbi:MAG: glycogen synthase [Oscillospiraceae bacterium]
MEPNGCANLLKAGCVFADHINTVSQATRARSARRLTAGARGNSQRPAAPAVRHLNGIDTAVFDPRTTAASPRPYSADDLSGKAVRRAALCRELGLEIGAHTPIVAMVTRMTPQKGFDLVQCVLDELMNEQDMAFVLLGTATPNTKTSCAAPSGGIRPPVRLHRPRRGAVAPRVRRQRLSAHAVSFEPCGLSQMIAMRYGIRRSRETGGLRDSVQPYNQFNGEGTGFSFANFNAYELADTIRRALALYHNDHDAYCRVQRQAMSQDFSFTRSAEDYAHLYLLLLPEDTTPKHDAADEAFRSPIGGETGASVRLAFADTGGARVRRRRGDLRRCVQRHRRDDADARRF